MAQSKIELLLSLKNRLKGGLSKAENQLKSSTKRMKSSLSSFKQEHVQAFSAMKDEIPGLARGVELLSNPYAAVTVGVVALGVAAFKAGQHLLEVSTEIKAQQRTIATAFDITGQKQKEVTAYSSAMSKVLKIDHTELTETANAYFKEFKDGGASIKGSFNLIKQGMQATNGKLDINQIREYSAQMKQLGLTQEETMALMVKSYKGGFYDDKPIDALKEAGLSLREMTKPQIDAINGLEKAGAKFMLGGKKLSGAKFMSGIKDGSVKGMDAIKSLMQAMKGVDIQTKQTAIADIFKGAGEDSGSRFFKELLQGELSMKKLVDASDPFIKSQERRLALETKIAMKTQEFAPTFTGIKASFDTLILKGKLLFYDIIGGAVGWLKEHKQTFIDIWTIIKDRLTPAFTIIKLALKGVWWLAKQAFKRLWQGVELVVAAFKGMKKIADWVWTGIGKGIDWIFNKLGGEGSLMEKLFGDGDSVWSGIKSVFTKLGNAIKQTTELSTRAFKVIKAALSMDMVTAKKEWNLLKSDWKNLGKEPKKKPLKNKSLKEAKVEIKVKKEDADFIPGAIPTAPTNAPNVETVVGNNRQAKNIIINIDALIKGDQTLHTEQKKDSMSMFDFQQMMKEYLILATNDVQRSS